MVVDDAVDAVVVDAFAVNVDADVVEPTSCMLLSSVRRNATSRSRSTSVSFSSIRLKRRCSAVRCIKVKFKWVCKPSSAISLKCAAYRCAIT